MERANSSSHLPVHVLLQTDGAVGGGAAAERIRGSAAGLAQALSLGLELPGLHLLQGLDGHPVHGALRGEGGRGAVRGSSCPLSLGENMHRFTSIKGSGLIPLSQ